jgi:Zn-dependent protease with chaperone function
MTNGVSRRGGWGVGWAAVFFLWAVPAVGEVPVGRDPAAEREVERRLEAMAPEAVSDWRAATTALDAGRPEEARAGFLRVLDRVPEFPDALRRLSYVTPDPAEALALARRAQALQPWFANQAAVLRALLPFLRRGDGGGDRAAEARVLAASILAERPPPADALLVVGMAAIALDDLPLLERAVRSLRAAGADDAGTHYLAALAAASREDWSLAEEEILAAGARGLAPEAVDRFLATTGIRDRNARWRLGWTLAAATGGWLALLLVLSLLGRYLSARTVRTVEAEAEAGTAEPSPAVRRLRLLYRRVIAVTAVVFYLSLPFALVLGLVGMGAFVYLFVVIGYLPIYLVAAAVIAAVMTVGSLVGALFWRRRDEDPGERLREEEAPGLFELLREVASKVGTRPVDEVYLTPGVEVAVLERGSWWVRNRGTARRCLVLGVGTLDGMTRSQLAAILAHEYGHFSNRDTAGGDLALRARVTLLRWAERMARGGAARGFNPAWWFVLGFHTLYVRISHGASRLQEVLADRWAALTVGPAAFTEGLRHVVRRSVEFDDLAGREIEAVRLSGLALRSLYSLTPDTVAERRGDTGAAAATAEEIREIHARRLVEAMTRPASPYDSHPEPSRRIAWVERLVGVPRTPSDDRPAWSLFRDRSELQRRMTAVVAGRIGVVPASDLPPAPTGVPVS